MKRKVLAALLCLSMAGTLLMGCGGGSSDSGSSDAQETTEAAEDTVDDAADGADEADDAAAADDAEEGDDAGEESSGGPYTFGYTCMDGTNPFFVTIEDAIRTAVEEKGDKLISTDPANDVSLQIAQIEDMIAQGMDGIFLNPAEAEGILPALDALKEADVPIVNFDTEVADLSYVATYAGSITTMQVKSAAKTW